jgi:DNA repair exonuclease SbcCD nuclease subunit
MRFAHLADTHLGYRQYNLDEREEDFYNAWHEAVEKIIQKGCDFVIHSGDLFDEPRPHVRAIVEVRKALDKLHEQGIAFFTIAGNHDILMRRGAMIPHAIYKRIEVLTPKKPWREFEGIFVGGLPYHSKIHANAMKERLGEVTKKASKYDKKILVLHQGIDKYFPLEFELRFAEIPKGFDYYAFGHVHKRVIDEFSGAKLAYPGSTEIWRIDELKDYEKNGKGFFIVDIEDFEVEQVNLEGIRPFIKAEVDADLNIGEIKEKIVGGKKPIVNLTIASDIHEYQQVYQALVRELNEEVLYLDIKRKHTSEEAEVFSDKTIDIKELMTEVMKDFSEREREFAYSVFKLLSRGEVDEARAITEEFYKESLKEETPGPKKPKKPKIETGQSSLEAFT